MTPRRPQKKARLEIVRPIIFGAGYHLRIFGRPWSECGRWMPHRRAVDYVMAATSHDARARQLSPLTPPFRGRAKVRIYTPGIVCTRCRLRFIKRGLPSSPRTPRTR